MKSKFNADKTRESMRAWVLSNQNLEQNIHGLADRCDELEQAVRRAYTILNDLDSAKEDDISHWISIAEKLLKQSLYIKV